jgi:hypothetical protein
MPQNRPVQFGILRRSLTAPAVLKSKPGILLYVVCLQNGSITLNNCATVGAASGGNQLAGTPATLTAGQVLPLNLACTVGIVASAVTGQFDVLMSS